MWRGGFVFRHAPRLPDPETLMADDIPKDYQRKLSDTQVSAIVAQSRALMKIIEEAGLDCREVTGVELEEYQARTDALEAKHNELRAHVMKTEAALHELIDREVDLPEETKERLNYMYSQLDGSLTQPRPGEEE